MLGRTYRLPGADRRRSSQQTADAFLASYTASVERAGKDLELAKRRALQRIAEVRDRLLAEAAARLKERFRAGAGRMEVNHAP